MKPLLLALAALHLALAGWMNFAPASFATDVAGYPPPEPHWLGDLASWTAAFGVALAVAAWRPAWRLPVLSLGALQYALHTINHIWDAGETDPAALGPLNAVLIAVGTLLLAVLALRVREARR